MIRLLTSTILVAALWQTPALAGSDIADPVVEQIEADGYTVSDVTRTWLGRIVITAVKGANLREVVLNRTTGEVLRDRLFPMPATTPSVAPNSPSGTSRGRGMSDDAGDQGHGADAGDNGDGHGADAGDNGDGDGGDGDGGEGGGGEGGGGGSGDGGSD